MTAFKLSKDNKAFFSRLLLLAFPIIIQEFMYSAVNMLDNIMIGRLGLYEITAVGLANQVFFLFILVMFGINSGSSIFMGQFWGNNDKSSVHKTMGVCVVLGLIGTLFFFVMAFFFPHKIMYLYSGGNKEVDALGVSYLKIVSFAYFFCAISVAINTSLKSIGKTFYPMLTTLIALIANGVLNFVFIFIFKWGVPGAAIATLISRILELTAQLIIINVKRLPIRGKLSSYFSADRKFLKEYFIITTPVIINEALWAVGNTLYTIIYKYTGTEGQGAVQIASTLQHLFMVLSMALGSATGIMLANLLGAGEREKAISYSRKSLAVGTAIGIAMGVFILLASPFVLSFFKVSDLVKGYARNIIYIMSFTILFRTLNFTTIVGILRSGGDTKFCLLIDVLSVWLVGVPFAYVGAKFFGLPVYFVYFLACCEEYVKLVFALVRTFKNKWARSVIN